MALYRTMHLLNRNNLAVWPWLSSSSMNLIDSRINTSPYRGHMVNFTKITDLRNSGRYRIHWFKNRWRGTFRPFLTLEFHSKIFRHKISTFFEWEHHTTKFSKINMSYGRLELDLELCSINVYIYGKTDFESFSKSSKNEKLHSLLTILYGP